MLDLFHTPSPRFSNYQEFYGGGSTRDWVKPRGASMVRIMLLGAGGGASGGSPPTGVGGKGGGSGAVTQWIGPAIFIPDVLRIYIGAGGVGGSPTGEGANGEATNIIYQAKDGTGYTLLTANAGQGGDFAGSGTGGTGGAASSNNFFGASGIFKSVSGDDGKANGLPVTASTTTFLCGGASGSTSFGSPGAAVNSRSGYPSLAGGLADGGAGASGFFLTQPIMFGYGGSGGGGKVGSSGGKGGNGGTGCGGGGGGVGSGNSGVGGRGGDGACFIWAW